MATANAPITMKETLMPSILPTIRASDRFDKHIYIPLPDLKARQHMFKVHLGDTPHSLTERDFEHLARKIKGFSGSDISVYVNEVLFEPVRKTQDAQFFIKDSDMWISCGPRQSGAVQTDMQELAAQGLASKEYLIVSMLEKCKHSLPVV